MFRYLYVGLLNLREVCLVREREEGLVKGVSSPIYSVFLTPRRASLFTGGRVTTFLVCVSNGTYRSQGLAREFCGRLLFQGLVSIRGRASRRFFYRMSMASRSVTRRPFTYYFVV